MRKQKKSLKVKKNKNVPVLKSKLLEVGRNNNVHEKNETWQSQLA